MSANIGERYQLTGSELPISLIMCDIFLCIVTNFLSSVFCIYGNQDLVKYNKFVNILECDLYFN